MHPHTEESTADNAEELPLGSEPYTPDQMNVSRYKRLVHKSTMSE
jgi:hypothetical protein